MASESDTSRLIVVTSFIGIFFAMYLMRIVAKIKLKISTDREMSELVETLNARELSCAEISAIVGAFTFSSKKRAILIALYPKLRTDERPGFVDVLEGALNYDFDRKDVLRELKLA